MSRVYVQQVEKLEKQYPDIYAMLNEGHFTLRRQDKFSSGVWTDMFIEQTLMR